MGRACCRELITELNTVIMIGHIESENMFLDCNFDIVHLYEIKIR